MIIQKKKKGFLFGRKRAGGGRRPENEFYGSCFDRLEVGEEFACGSHLIHG